jgi:hypothetical protein
MFLDGVSVSPTTVDAGFEVWQQWDSDVDPTPDPPNVPAIGDRNSFLVTGKDIGIPRTNDDGEINGGWDVGPTLVPYTPCGAPTEFGDVQVWFGTFIDPANSSNFSKFVNISGGIGTPVDPAIAADAFGTPTLRFKGNHTQFTQNTGTGGDFALVGTGVDFTPSPSYG